MHAEAPACPSNASYPLPTKLAHSERGHGPNQADTAGKLVLAGIAQDLAAGAQHDRQLTGVDVEALDQRLGLPIGVGIQYSRDGHCAQGTPAAE